MCANNCITSSLEANDCQTHETQWEIAESLVGCAKDPSVCMYMYIHVHFQADVDTTHTPLGLIDRFT